MRWIMLSALFVCSGCSNTSDTVADVEDGELSSNDAGHSTDVGEMSDRGISDVGILPQPAQSVGYRTEELAYTPVGHSEARTLPVSLWYPSEDTEGTPAFYKLYPSEQAFENAVPALSGPAPVLLFSHGRSGFSEYSSFLSEHFALNGWIVAGVDHVGDRVSDRDTPVDIYSLRPQDVTALLDHLASLPEEHPLHGTISDRIALAGHSFGGYTTFAIAGADYDMETLRADCDGGWGSDFCGNLNLYAEVFAAGFWDDRILAALPIAPGNSRLFGTEGLSAIKIPVMFITGAMDRNAPDEEQGIPVWDRLQGPEHRWVKFLTAGHFTFTNICPFIGPLGEDNGCDEGFIDLDEAQMLTNRYALAFARRHVLGDESDAELLDANDSPRNDVEYLKK